MAKKKTRQTLALRVAAVERLPTAGKETTHTPNGGHRRASGACHGDGEPGEKKSQQIGGPTPSPRRGMARRFDEMREIKIDQERYVAGGLRPLALRTSPGLGLATHCTDNSKHRNMF